jgi:hypothetical protein
MVTSFILCETETEGFLRNLDGFYSSIVVGLLFSRSALHIIFFNVLPTRMTSFVSEIINLLKPGGYFTYHRV